MSFLAGRLAGKEGAYFFQESKHAVTRHAAAQKKPQSSPPPPPSPPPGPDVLPEILRHSLPSKLFRCETLSDSPPSNCSASKWALPSDANGFSSVNAEAMNPLRSYLSLPQVTFGPKRWQLPGEQGSVMASTANDLRRQRDPQPTISPEDLKTVTQGFTQIGKAFAVATALVFGGATLVFGVVASKLELETVGDIRTKVRALVEPKHEMFRRQLEPLKDWAENMSKKWHIEKNEDVKEKRIVKELSKIWGAKSST